MSLLVEISNLKKYFPIRSTGVFAKTIGHVQAVEDISFAVHEGETIGIVGESGCGKSTMGRLILHLIKPTAGEVIFDGQVLSQLNQSSLRKVRRYMQLIFQDPYASLNPRATIGSILEEPLIVHKLGNNKERRDIVKELLNVVGLDSQHVAYYPHEFSGGQRQRIAIARALVTKPKLVVADEPVSALDVSIQAQILNLMKDLQEQFHLTYIFISHDLSVVRHVSDKVGVMYLGRLVEFSTKTDLYTTPLHPYTQALLVAAPSIDRKPKQARLLLDGDLPNPANPPPGCTFHTRCPHCRTICKESSPELKPISSGHLVACHLVKRHNTHLLIS